MSQFIRDFRDRSRDQQSGDVKRAFIQPIKDACGKFTPLQVGGALLFWGWIGWWVLTPSSPSSAPPSIALSPSASALDKMSAVFKGNYSRDQIDDLLSRVMQMYGSSLAEADYGRWGDVLVTLRKTSHPVSEMEILRCMRAMGPKMHFTGAAAMCAASKQLGM